MWTREKADEKRMIAVEFFAVLLAIFCLIGGQFIAFGVFCVIFLFTRLYLYYINHVGEELILINEKELKRKIIDHESEWTLHFVNGRMPIWNATLEVLYRDVTEPRAGDFHSIHSVVHWNGKFSINKHEELTLKLPLKAIKRGKTRILAIRIHIPHLFGYGETVIRYNPYIKQEILVYPRLQKVVEYRSHMQFRPGQSLNNQSIYEDLSLLQGTREYDSSDSFQRINWKATARTQQLHTNIYEHITNHSWLITLNISHENAKSILMESIIKQAAYMIHQAHREGIPYSLAVNVRTKGAIPFYYIPIGQGDQQLQKTLEVLSILSSGDLVMPNEGMLARLKQMDALQPVILHFGVINDETSRWLSNVASHHHVWTIRSEAEGGVASKWALKMNQR